LRQDLRQHDHGRLRWAVGAEVRVRVAARHRAHRDDRAAGGLERRIGRLRQKPRCARVDGEHAIPVVDRVFDQRAGAVDPGVAHQAVEATEPADGLTHDAPGRIDASHVAVERERLGLVLS